MKNYVTLHPKRQGHRVSKYNASAIYKRLQRNDYNEYIYYVECTSTCADAYERLNAIESEVRPAWRLAFGILTYSMRKGSLL